MRDFAHGKVLRAAASKVQPAHGGSRQHGQRFSQLNASLGVDVHEFPHCVFLSVVWLGGVAGGGANALQRALRGVSVSVCVLSV